MSHTPFPYKNWLDDIANNSRVGGGGPEVSVLVFYSHDPYSNLTKVYRSACLPSTPAIRIRVSQKSTIFFTKYVAWNELK